MALLWYNEGMTHPIIYPVYIPEREACCIADQACDAPANLEPQVKAKSFCFACGRPVCTKCSSRRKYYDYGVKRLCNDCQVEHLDDGDDKVVMARLRKLVGA